MTHGALFNGIGGFQLAASWCGWDNVFSVEIDKWCNKVTAQHFPNCTQYEDIYNFNGKPYAGSIDVISGGFPCQPFSLAGKRKGKEDDRHLWPEMLRVIQEIKPTWVVGENVAGIVNMVLDEVLSDLEGIGYESEALIIPACATNAPHRRDRVWIIAENTSGIRRKHAQYETERKRIDRITWMACTQRRNVETLATDSDSIGTRTGCGEIQRKNEQVPKRNDDAKPCDTNQDASNTDDVGLRLDKQGPWQESATRSCWDADWYEVATSLCRVDDGLPGPVDRAHRLKALGNAIVPQVAYEIFRAIMTKE